MSEQTKNPEAIPGELTKDQLDGVAGGFVPVDGLKPIKPVVPPVLGDILVET